MEVHLRQRDVPHSYQNPTPPGFCPPNSLDSPREYSWDKVFLSLPVNHYCLIINMLFCVLWGFAAVLACCHGILNSSGYLAQGHATKPTWNTIAHSRRNALRRSKRKECKRFTRGREVIHSRAVDSPTQSVVKSYSSLVNSRSMEEIGKVGISQESGGESLSKYVVPGRNQGTNDIQCMNEPSKEGALLETDSRKVCQHDQEMNSVTVNH